MTRQRLLLCVALLALVAAPLLLPGSRPTHYGGWPALGFCLALFIVAGWERRWLVFTAATVVSGIALGIGYDLNPLFGLVGSVTITIPGLLSAWLMLGRRGRPGLRFEQASITAYTVVTTISGAVCGVLSALLAIAIVDTRGVLITLLLSTLAGTTAQLVVLPLLMRVRGDSSAAGGQLELTAQRVLMVLLVGGVLVFSVRMGVAFLAFPLAAWGAIRASRLEAHIQLLVVSVTAYGMTVLGHGPLTARASGLPQDLAPALVYLFIAALCYLVVPLALTVQRLASMTAQAWRSAGAVERMLDAATGTLVIATDADSRITHFNSGAEEALGWTLAQVRGRNPKMFHTREEIARQADHFGVEPRHTLVALAQAASGEKRDWEFRAKDGSARLTSLSLSEITDVKQQVVGYIATGEDITDRVRAQEALVAALDREHASVLRLQEVDHVKEELISNVSHELRTPITSISGYVELLSGGDLGDLNAMQLDAVQRIERNGTRLAMLVEDLLTMSRAESGNLEITVEEIDLRDAASDAFELLQSVRQSRPLDVRLELPEQPVFVLGDSRALERVATNLLSNAIKFTPEGGVVSLAVRDEGEDAVLEVEDTGIGISQDDQHRLFTRFFRSATATEQAIQGTGLGLSIVQTIVNRHGGTVHVASAPGKGTTVTVTLPGMGQVPAPRREGVREVSPSADSAARRA